MSATANDLMDKIIGRSAARHTAEVLRGEHDDACEWTIRSRVCHCHKRKREKDGFTEPPEIWFPSPVCGHCCRELAHDGDSWNCEQCQVTWDSHAGDGDTGTFTDDHGQLSWETT